jgi:hypothetical protein
MSVLTMALAQSWFVSIGRHEPARPIFWKQVIQASSLPETFGQAP